MFYRDLTWTPAFKGKGFEIESLKARVYTCETCSERIKEAIQFDGDYNPHWGTLGNVRVHDKGWEGNLTAGQCDGCGAYREGGSAGYEFSLIVMAHANPLDGYPGP